MIPPLLLQIVNDVIRIAQNEKKGDLSDIRNEMGDKQYFFSSTSPLTLEKVTVETQWVVNKGIKKY